MAQTALCLMAHPDDAEISAGGTLALLGRQGWEIHIASMTPGDCGSREYSASEVSRTRRQEGANAAAKIGATYHCLDQRDLRIFYDDATVMTAVELIRTVRPSVVFTHPPQDYMLDHEQVHLLARSAAFSFSIPNASQIPPPEGGMVPHLYYADPVEGTDPYSGEVALATAVIDISEVFPRKADMLACHASQREWLRKHHGMDEYMEAMQRHAAMRGNQAATTYAEAFRQHRGHPYPQHDLLSELLSQD